MDIQTFLNHWQIKEDPFRGEEARDDPVFRRLLKTGTPHPDFEKIFSSPDNPSTAVVFGEKGSGKTALRLLMEERIEDHNEQHPDSRGWAVRYDDLNPILDRVAHSLGVAEGDEKVLRKFRLVDHMDAILALATTELVSGLLEGNARMALPRDAARRMRRMPERKRIDLAQLAALYDQPRGGTMLQRAGRLRSMVRVGRVPALKVLQWLGIAAILAAIGFAIAFLIINQPAVWIPIVMGAAAALGLVLLAIWGWRHVRLWSLARRMQRDLRAVERSAGDLRQALARLPAGELANQPIPLPGDVDSRYQLIVRLLGVLEELDYKGLVVLVDRVDEPAAVNGDSQKMKSLVWPMFNNKFMQQEGMGVKMLLPVELRHMLRQEDSEFFQRARLDKQHMIDRLVWSGTTLYDMCSRRLQACREQNAEPIALIDLFDEQTSRTDLIDALDQMHQPRDAFKFLYQVVHEHCAQVPEEEPVWKIPRLTLTQVRKQQSQRVQDFYRGLTPT